MSWIKAIFIIILLLVPIVGCTSKEGFNLEMRPDEVQRREPPEDVAGPDPEPEETKSPVTDPPWKKPPVDLIPVGAIGGFAVAPSFAVASEAEFRGTIEMAGLIPYRHIEPIPGRSTAEFLKMESERECENSITADIALEIPDDGLSRSKLSWISLTLYGYKDRRYSKIIDLRNEVITCNDRVGHCIARYRAIKNFNCRGGEDVAAYPKYFISIQGERPSFLVQEALCEKDSMLVDPDQGFGGRQCDPSYPFCYVGGVCSAIRPGYYLEVDTPAAILNSVRE